MRIVIAGPSGPHRWHCYAMPPDFGGYASALHNRCEPNGGHLNNLNGVVLNNCLPGIFAWRNCAPVLRHAFHGHIQIKTLAKKKESEMPRVRNVHKKRRRDQEHDQRFSPLLPAATPNPNSHISAYLFQRVKWDESLCTTSCLQGISVKKTNRAGGGGFRVQKLAQAGSIHLWDHATRCGYILVEQSEGQHAGRGMAHGCSAGCDINTGLYMSISTWGIRIGHRCGEPLRQKGRERGLAGARKTVL